MTNTSSNTETTTKYIWRYKGMRLDRKGKLYHVWEDHEGEERGYYKLIGRVIGAKHSVEADGSNVYPGTLRFVEGVSDDLTREWVLLDRGAKNEKAANDAVKRMARESGDEMGQLTLIDVRRMVARQFGTNKAGMVAAVLAYIQAEMTTQQARGE